MKRSFTYVLLLVVCFAYVGPLAAQDAPTPEPVGLRPDAPAYAVHGPYWVGTMQQAVETDSHPATLRLWYPALNPDGLDTSIVYDWQGTTVTGHALQDAATNALGGPYPLIVFSHGSNGAPIVAPYLMEHLASQGFVVMSMDHADSWVNPAPPEDFTGVFTRPQDVSWQIDYADVLNTEDGALPGMIDTGRVAVMGHSYGGETALLAAGAALDFGPGSWCGEHPDTVSSLESGSAPVCATAYPGATEAIAAAAGLEAVPTGVWPAWSDDRIDAIVPISPGLWDFSTASLSGVTVPTMVIYGTADHWVYANWPLYDTLAFDAIGSPMKSAVAFANGDHMLTVDTCDTMPLLVDMGVFFFCSDPVWDMDRAHDLINHFTTAFLLDTLKGDEAAHAALAPEAVAFPGITYESEGF